jgi:ppGpp synthetase/RelA/SpoT-type nucleotidyltranferase
LYLNNKEKFLTENNVSEEALERCTLDWDLIAKIGEEHQRRTHELTSTAEYFAKTIQRCESVHSVRWRVKSPEHLMEKLIRKTDPSSEFYSDKYKSITLENYHEIVTDLVGVRAIHLFKDQFAEIDGFLCNSWEKFEKTTVYKRVGDLDDDFDSLEGDTDIKDHDAGYRSIHYVFKTKPARYEVLVEVQVRTIFEEGWSEIDHTVRYPNFSDNQLVGYFLKVFNRLAGSADEMGSFVKSLVSELDKASEEMKLLQEEREQSNMQIEDLFKELSDLSGQNKDYNEKIEALRKEVNKLKNESSHTRQGLGGIKRKALTATHSGLNMSELNPTAKAELIKIARSALKSQNDKRNK